MVVFNPLNIAREDLVEASVSFPDGMPKAVHVTGPDGKEVPAQISQGKVNFVAKVPSVGYAVYDVQPGEGAASTVAKLQASENSLENQYYRVKLNAEGDVASIFDKSLGEELLSAPARLAISYDNPLHWPAWNMDWDQAVSYTHLDVYKRQARMRASRRSSAPRSSAGATRSSTLSATRRFSTMSSASHTLPMPPRARWRTTL